MPKFACMELMWGNPDGQNLEALLAELSAAGFDGVALRGATLAGYFGKAADLRALLKKYKLRLSAAYLPVDRAAAWLTPLCALLPQLGCADLVTHGAQGGTDAERLAWAKRLDTWGTEAAAAGVRLSFHHHSHTAYETFEQYQVLLDNSDPNHVALFLDTGHATQDFAGHPAATRACLPLQKYPRRPRMVEFKAWTPETGLNSELGTGPLDLDAVVDELVKLGHTGDNAWVTLEQNAPTAGNTPAACAKRSLTVAKASFARHAVVAR